jgi:glutaredoxin
VITITLACACQKEAPPTPGQVVQASALPKIRVKPKAKLLLTFAKPDGTFETVNELSKVPEERRGWVRVVDLKIKPSKRLDHELVYVADMREKGKDGTFPYVVLPRATFEAAAVNRAHSGATAKEKEPTAKGVGKGVILYTTRWCPACRAARDYMKKNGIPFVEKDIEQDRKAAAELLAKARRAGISASGVPVLDVNGTLIQGFDPQRLNALLGKK